MRMLFYGMLLFFVVLSCQNDTQKTATATSEKETPEKVVPPTKYILTPFTPSPSYPGAKLELVGYKDEKFDFTVSGGNYELGVQTSDAPQKMCANSDQGQHIHLILDKQPYAAKYEADFEYEVTDGGHHVLAFLSRSYHESIKAPGAFIGVKGMFENGTMTQSEPITEPTLFYSRPKGTYIGKANTDKVMLDFYILNANLGNDYTVQANINGEIHTIVKWQPYYIEGLPMGENIITLTLLDSKGKPVSSPLNPVTRKIMLKADPAE